MKKLMFAAVACAAMSGLAIESQNIVGYATSDLANGNKALAPQFVPISKEGFSINDIKFAAADLYDVSMQTLTPGGTSATMWMWNDYTIEDPENPGEFIGFWDDGSGEISSFKLNPGDGLWIGGKAGDTMLTSGQVLEEDVIVNLVNGNVLVANPFPVPVSINDLLFTANDLYDISLQTLTPGGTMATMWMWNDYTIEDPENPGEFIGFWDDGSGEIPSFKLSAGEALWVGGKAGDSVRFPAPEL